jgi:outer membrane protein TolC
MGTAILAMLIAITGAETAATEARREAPPPAGPVVTLDEAIREARKANPSYAASREKLEQAEAWKRKALAAFLPTWSAAASYTHYNKGYSYEIPDPSSLKIDFSKNPPFYFEKYREWTFLPEDVYSVSTFLTLPLLNMSSVARYQAVQSQAKAATFQSQAWENEFLYSVTSAYYAAMGAKKVTAITAENVEVAEAHLKSAKARHQAGELPKLPFLRAEIELEKARQEQRKAANGYDSAREALAVLMGRDTGFEVAEAVPPPFPPDMNPADGRIDAQRMCDEAMRNRPEIAALEMQVKAAEKTRQEVYYRFIPTLQASGAFYYTNLMDIVDQNYQWLVTLGANWTLYDGGVRYADMRERKSTLAEASMNLAAQRANVRGQARQAAIEADSCSANMASARRQVELAVESQRVASINFQQGLVTPMEVTDANATLAGARLNLAREELACQQTGLKLLKTIGTMREQFK